MKFVCTTDEYNDLYARWLDKPGTLLDLGGWSPALSLLDLCGGTGAVSLEAVRRGASQVLLYDLNPRLLHPRVLTMSGRAEQVNLLLHNPYDYVVMRQALGYVDIKRTFKAVAHVTQKGSIFAFNSFVKPKWAWKRYTYEGQRYWEVSGHFLRVVFHVQGKGLKWDVTLFRHYMDWEITEALEPFFTWKKIVSGKSVRWLATRL